MRFQFIACSIVAICSIIVLASRFWANANVIVKRGDRSLNRPILSAERNEPTLYRAQAIEQNESRGNFGSQGKGKQTEKGPGHARKHHLSASRGYRSSRKKKTRMTICTENGHAPALQTWVRQIRATAFKSEGASESRAEECQPKNFVVIRNQRCGQRSFGNCLLGLASAFHLAILTDSIPIFVGMPLQEPWQLHHGWSFVNLTRCYLKRFGNCKIKDLSWIVNGFEWLPKTVVELRDQSKGYCASFKYSNLYYGQNLVLSDLFLKQSMKMFPDSFTTPFSFGTFDIVLATFLRFVPSATRSPQTKVFDDASWVTEGPLITVHVRRGECRKTNCSNLSEAMHGQQMGSECLKHVISKLHVPEARVYIATTKYAAWNRYSNFYNLTSEGIAMRNTGNRRVHFRAGPATYEKYSKSNHDLSSGNFFFDWYVIARSDIVLRPMRTTFSGSAIACGRPRAVWLYHGSSCQALNFREPCMHGKSFVKANRTTAIFKNYSDYCESMGEGAS